MYMFDYCKPSVMMSLEPTQQMFVAKLIERDVEKAAKEMGRSPETVYRGYSKGLYGGSREAPDFTRTAQ